MKKGYLPFVLAAAMAGSLLAGCGSASTAETTAKAADTAGETTTQESTTEAAASADDGESEDDSEFIPDDFVQERALTNKFDRYEDIINYLDGENEGFAYVQINGSTEYLLAISDKVSTENNTSTEAYFYTFNDDNKLVNIGLAFGDENHPLLCDGTTLYMCSDTEYGEMQINPKSHGLTYMKNVTKNQSDGTYSGFVREKADEESTEVKDVETDEQFAALFDAISDVPAIKFTRAAYGSYDEIISGLPEGAGYAYIKLNGYEGDILAVCSATYEDEGTNCSIDATLYAENNGKAELLASVQTGGTAYPVTVEDGILYYNTRTQFAQADVTKNEDGKYQLNYIKFAAITYNSAGEESFETKGDISASDLSSKDDFYALFEETEGKTPVNFTLVK